MIENTEEIVLDMTNNVFVGPDAYFKVIIDEFDGTTVKAWHLEDSKGNITLNLADRAKGKHIDLLVNTRCRTVWHFVGRFAPMLVIEQYNQIKTLKTAN
ncbi:MAG: hypothetical protein RIN56_03280 [Sporomusaceae bacterium]|nr:hypothetical protein [Sporomusaceae bacterium]